ncbi:MAG: HD domain-containing phosphohydrolase [Pseudomonadota bacterium]
MTEIENLKRRFENIKFLYVDDEPDNLASFRIYFDETFEVLTESDPLNALQIVRQEKDLAVLVVDQVMPKMTGLALATSAKKLRPALSCLMITGNATKQLAIDSIRSRVFYEFLEKPVDFSAKEIRQLLISAVQEHLLERVKVEYRLGTIELIGRLIDEKDGHTQRHSERVTEWAVKIARKLELSERDVVRLHEGALLHDIGKIGIPDDILKKPGKLTDLERKVIQTHTTRGGDLLWRVEPLKELASIARYHHERPDGKGYPEGLAADKIPIHASIVALADFFEALSAKRPYKEPWSVPDIVAEVGRQRGTQFPEKVVDAFFSVLEEEGILRHEELEKAKASHAA